MVEIEFTDKWHAPSTSLAKQIIEDGTYLLVRHVEPGTIQSVVDEVHSLRDRIEETA